LWKTCRRRAGRRGGGVAPTGQVGETLPAPAIGRRAATADGRARATISTAGASGEVGP
jgi:hypothetical protein